MPYPILTLPYPFAKRLRQLLSPFELQDLQIAAGHTVINTLKPIVLSHKDYGIHFEGNKTTDPNVITTCTLNRISWINSLFYHNMINIRKNDRYFFNCNAVILTNMTTTALESVGLNSLLIKTARINIEYTNISNRFLYTVSKIAVGSTKLDILKGHFDEDVTFLTIFGIFPRLNTILITNAYFGWLNDLSSLEKRLKLIFIWYESFEKVFSFRPEELYSFVANQGPEFRLHLRVSTADVHITDKIKPFIDPRFQFIDAENGNLVVSYKVSSSGPMQKTVYVVQDKKRKLLSNDNKTSHLTTKMPRNF